MPRENKRLKNDHRIILIERESCFLLHAPRREERGERRWAWFIARSAPSRWALGRGFIIIFCLIEYNVIHRSIHRRVGAFAFLWRHAIKKGKKKTKRKKKGPNLNTPNSCSNDFNWATVDFLCVGHYNNGLRAASKEAELIYRYGMMLCVSCCCC